MKKWKSIVGVMIVLSVALTSSSSLAETVVVHGHPVSCTNRCVVTTYPDGTYSVDDCCGGRVSNQLDVGQIDP